MQPYDGNVGHHHHHAHAEDSRRLTIALFLILLLLTTALFRITAGRVFYGGERT